MCNNLLPVCYIKAVPLLSKKGISYNFYTFRFKFGFFDFRIKYMVLTC